MPPFPLNSLSRRLIRQAVLRVHPDVFAGGNPEAASFNAESLVVRKMNRGFGFFLSALGTCTLAWFRPSRDFSAQGLQTNVEIILCFNALDEKRCKSRKEKPDAVPAKACRHRRRRLFGSSHS